jgi:hypothetical protein
MSYIEPINYYSGQGILYLSKRDSGGNPTAYRDIGNAPKIELAPAVDRREHKESRTGGRLIDKILTTVKKAELRVTLEDIKKANVELLLAGSQRTLAGGSFTSGSPDIFPTGLVANDIVKLSKPNASALTIKDSAGSPVTLALNVDYEVVDLAHGLIRILSIAGKTQPFKAEYTYAATDAVTMYTGSDDQDYLAYVSLFNTEPTTDQRIGFEVNRVIFDPAQLLALISDETATFDIKGTVLRDNARASNPDFGGFARWIYVDPNL